MLGCWQGFWEWQLAFHVMCFQLIDWLIDWLNEWLIDWLIDLTNQGGDASDPTSKCWKLPHCTAWLTLPAYIKLPEIWMIILKLPEFRQPPENLHHCKDVIMTVLLLGHVEPPHRQVHIISYLSIGQSYSLACTCKWMLFSIIYISSGQFFMATTLQNGIRLFQAWMIQIWVLWRHTPNLEHNCFFHPTELTFDRLHWINHFVVPLSILHYKKQPISQTHDVVWNLW